jgi:hypothetical protein
MSHRLKRPTLAVLSAALAGIALAACGGSGPGADNPSSSASGDAVKFERCMREHGVHVETPTAGGPTRIRGGVKGSDVHTLEAAGRACRKYSPGAAAEARLTPAQKVAQEEAVQKFAKCMREHGVKLETKTSSAGGGLEIRIGIHREAGEGGPNPNSPAFQEAQRACQSLLPRPPGTKGAFPKGAPPKGTGSEEQSALSSGG